MTGGHLALEVVPSLRYETPSLVLSVRTLTCLERSDPRGAFTDNSMHMRFSADEHTFSRRSQVSAHGMTVLLRRTPSQTAPRHSPRTGVLRSSDDTLCNFERGLSPQRRWATFMPSKPSETAKSMSSRNETPSLVRSVWTFAGFPAQHNACFPLPKERGFDNLSRKTKLMTFSFDLNDRTLAGPPLTTQYACVSLS